MVITRTPPEPTNLNGAELHLEANGIPVYPAHIILIDNADFAQEQEQRRARDDQHERFRRVPYTEPLPDAHFYTAPSPDTPTAFQPAECQAISDTTGEYTYLVYPHPHDVDPNAQLRQRLKVARRIHPDCVYTRGPNTAARRLMSFLNPSPSIPMPPIGG